MKMRWLVLAAVIGACGAPAPPPVVPKGPPPGQLGEACTSTGGMSQGTCAAGLSCLASLPGGLCVASCPAKVIAPGFLENGVLAVLQPRLDYEKSYCNYKCVTCTLVCPAGALTPLAAEQKKVTKIGGAKFVKEKCIVHVKKKECLVCN